MAIPNSYWWNLPSSLKYVVLMQASADKFVIFWYVVIAESLFITMVRLGCVGTLMNRLTDEVFCIFDRQLSVSRDRSYYSQ